MSQGGSALLQVLWFLLRVIIYLISGHWVGKRPGEQEPQPQPAAPLPAPGAQGKALPRPRQLSDADKARLGSWLDGARARVPGLVERARLVPAGAKVLTALEQAIAPELQRLRVRLGAREVAPDGLAEQVQALEDALNAVEQSLEARQNLDNARSLADAEAIAEELLEPLREHLQSGPSERVLLAVPHVDAARAQRIAAHSRLTLLRGLANEPERIASDARMLARTVVEDLPGLSEDLREAHQLPRHVFVPPPQGSYDPETVIAATGVWLPELWADVLATYMLGPAYARFATAALARPSAPLETRVAYLHGRSLSARPPALVRVHVMARALATLGFHAAAEQLWGQFVTRHGDDVLLFPRADGSVVAVPTSFVLEEMEPLLTAMLEEPHAALLDHELLDVPGLAYLHGEDGEARSAAQSLASGNSVTYSPRIVAAGALLALEAHPERRAAIVDALDRSVRGAGTLEAVGAPGRAPQAGARPRSLKAMAHDRVELEAALVLGAVFERPHMPRAPRRGVGRGA